MNFNNIEINIDIQNINYVNTEINIDIHFNFNSQPCVRAQLDKLTRLYGEAFGNESEYVARLGAIRLRVETPLQKIATTATADAVPLTPKRSKNSTTVNSEVTAGMPFFYSVSRKFWRPNSELSDLWVLQTATQSV